MSESVAAAASLTQCSSVPKLLLTSASTLACSLVIRLVLSLGDHGFLGLRGFAFELRGLVARPPYLGTDRLVGRAMALAASWAAQQFENSLKAVARSSQEHPSSSCRRSWSLWARSGSSATSEDTTFTHLHFVLQRHLFHGGFEDSALLRQSVQGMHCLLIHVVSHVVCFKRSCCK